MPRGDRKPSLFKATDVTRAVKATRAGGVVVDRVEVQIDGKTGKIIVIGKSEPESKSAA